MNAILRISLEGQLQDVFEIEKILLAIFYKMGISIIRNIALKEAPPFNDV